MMRSVAWAPSLIGLAILFAAGTSAWSAEPVYTSASSSVVQVVLDQATLLKTPERTATVVIGNPLIADVSVQPGGTMVVTGKSHGLTNMIALDRAGQVLMNSGIEVQGPGGRIVVVYRGIERETYSCTPACERRITIGDTPNYFTANLTQSGTLTTQAQGTATA